MGYALIRMKNQNKNNFPIFIFWDMVDLKCEKCGQTFFFRLISMNIFLGMIQTILRIFFFKLKKIMLRFFAEMPLSANLFPLESSIQKHAGSRGVAPVGGAGVPSPPQIKKKLKKKKIDKKKILNGNFFFSESSEAYPKKFFI